MKDLLARLIKHKKDITASLAELRAIVPNVYDMADVASLTARGAKLQGKLELLTELILDIGALVPAPNTPLNAEEQAEALAVPGRIISAIKMFRARTGASLKESKDAVDDFRAMKGY